MNIPKNLLYTKSHEWVGYLDETTAAVGITDFAQYGLGDIVFVNLPKPGDKVVKETVFADVESVKAVSDIFSPLSGEILAINEEVLDAPQNLNSDPYGTWLVKISNITDKAGLIDAPAYEKICEEEN